MKILGISAFYHDSAACLTVDGEIISAVQEERFSRIKNDESFPIESVRYCLKDSGLSINDLDAVVFYDKPLLKFERLLETYYAFAPKGIFSFLKSMPVWMKQKLFLKKLIRDELLKIEDYDKKTLKLLFTEHHLSHSASSFFTSGFQKAAILTIDGVGEWATASISLGEGSDIKVLKELKFPHSLGLLYSAFTYYLGFKVNSGEYKLMGLAPYGNKKSSQTQDFVKIIKTELVEVKEDGSLWLNQQYFNYSVGTTMVKDSQWEKLFGFDKRSSEDKILECHCNLALAIQQVTEEIVLLMAKESKRITGATKLCLAGGVALNCVANGKLEQANIFDSIFIQPASGDSGGALGAALAAEYIYFEEKRYVNEEGKDLMKGSYLGPNYSNKDIQTQLRKFNPVYTQLDSTEDLLSTTANYLKEGNIVGWFQGKMEFGPRSLGARSILGNPKSQETQYTMNVKIKFRESFRPFAPAVLSEDVSRYFNFSKKSPYMLKVFPVNDEIIKELPEGFESFSMKDKLYTVKSDFQSITHVDLSARIQTVEKETNAVFYGLLEEYKKLTGDGMLVNTSFNVRGEPIVCSPEDAYRCFMRTDMDYLVIGNYVFEKTKQPKFQDKSEWKTEFVLD